MSDWEMEALERVRFLRLLERELLFRFLKEHKELIT